MNLVVGIWKESARGERRVAVVPGVIGALTKKGVTVLIEAGAGADSGYLDSAYLDAGASVVEERRKIADTAQILLRVRGFGPHDPDQGEADVDLIHSGQIVVGMLDPLGAPERIFQLARRKPTAFALELLPRISRAQSMDVLSSMASLAGYKAVLAAAHAAPRLFPMMMTAAGTIAAARVLVLGAGVAGLQAIATAKRLGAIVEAYDVRPEVREQVQSVGGRFVDLGLDTRELSDKSGYAKSQSAEFEAAQQRALAQHVRAADVIITTAQVPGRRAPVLLTAGMMDGMKQGAVIVDLAAEQGGNCVFTRPDETVHHDGVIILGPTNLAASMPLHASQLYAKNVTTFLLTNLVGKDGSIRLDMDDEITRETMVMRDGEITNSRVRDARSTQRMAG